MSTIKTLIIIAILVLSSTSVLFSKNLDKKDRGNLDKIFTPQPNEDSDQLTNIITGEYATLMINGFDPDNYDRKRTTSEMYPKTKENPLMKRQFRVLI